MLQIATVDLAAKNLQLPSTDVGIVVSQPYLPTSGFTDTEPFQHTPESRERLLAVIEKTLEVSRIAQHGAAQTHFTILPEYSIPFREGTDLIEFELNAQNWPSGTIVIGGTEGLSKEQYQLLTSAPHTHVEENNNYSQLREDQWVNCVITWIKANGVVERWIQPKLHPAWEELNTLHQFMFEGRSVYVFKGVLDNGVPFRFGSLVCFDWIANLGNKKPLEWILADLHEKAVGCQLPLTWLFVIQRNKKPSHNAFLAAVQEFFDQTHYPNALRDRACLLFANAAGSLMPGRVMEFGGCSLVFSPQSLFSEPKCAPTFSTGGPRFRDGSDLLKSYRDVYFRERGACIHSFAQLNPGAVRAGPAGRVFAVNEAHVFPIDGNGDARTPSGAVPACIKWINDELDAVSSLRGLFQNAALAPSLDESHQQAVAALRALPAQGATNCIALAARKCASTADDWDRPESKALAHVVHTLEILGTIRNIDISPTTLGHCSVFIEGAELDVIAVAGPTHEECIEHSKKLIMRSHRQVLLVSKDDENSSWIPRFGNFLRPTSAAVGAERKTTDPLGGLLHLGYQDLLQLFRSASSGNELEGGISAKLAE